MFDQTCLTPPRLANENRLRNCIGIPPLSARSHAPTIRRVIGDPAAASGGRAARLFPVGRETLHDRVYSALRGSLIHGEFDAGEALRIQDLAESLQTSAMPVREALARLVSEQALEALPNRTVRVPLITQERLDDLAHARCLIEGELTALALPHLTPADFDRLKALTEACEAAFRSVDPDKVHTTSDLNHAFHFHIYQAARSAVLIPIVESLWLQSGPYVRAAARIHDENRDIPAVHHHWTLVAALKRGDTAGAGAALTADITRSFDLIRGTLNGQAQARRSVTHG
jgi:DNA-binding GntR family transcriptional regulator